MSWMVVVGEKQGEQRLRFIYTQPRNSPGASFQLTATCERHREAARVEATLLAFQVPRHFEHLEHRTDTVEQAIIVD